MDSLQIAPDEMVHLPSPPDRSYQIFWPVQETFRMDTSDFQVIYPSYIDSRKRLSQGRRVSEKLAVDKPTVADISQALQMLSVRHVLQPNKGYSRDNQCLWDNPGRVLVDVTTYKKKNLLLEVSKGIPALPDRIARISAEAMQKEKEEEEFNQAATAASKAQPRKAIAAASTSNKKKGKKGKRK